jgi:hypothetical protein
VYEHCPGGKTEIIFSGLILPRLKLGFSIRWGHQVRQGVTIFTNTSGGPPKVPTQHNREAINPHLQATINLLTARTHLDPMHRAFSPTQTHTPTFQVQTIHSMPRHPSSQARQCTMGSNSVCITTGIRLSLLLLSVNKLPNLLKLHPLLNLCQPRPNYSLKLHYPPFPPALLPVSPWMELASWRF